MLMQALHDEGVELIFGYPGGAALHIYDAIFRQDKIDHILVRHEQGATHAADGYSRATGKPGVVLVTSGPGRNKCYYRNCDCIYGFHTNGSYFRAGC
jgi:acetolactate synthase-1/2/3 large subunit